MSLVKLKIKCEKRKITNTGCPDWVRAKPSSPSGKLIKQNLYYILFLPFHLLRGLLKSEVITLLPEFMAMSPEATIRSDFELIYLFLYLYLVLFLYLSRHVSHSSSDVETQLLPYRFVYKKISDCICVCVWIVIVFGWLQIPIKIIHIPFLHL